jgi:hypothetical protein
VASEGLGGDTQGALACGKRGLGQPSSRQRSNGDLLEGYEASGIWRSGADRGVSRSRGRDPGTPPAGKRGWGQRRHGRGQTETCWRAAKARCEPPRERQELGGAERIAASVGLGGKTQGDPACGERGRGQPSSRQRSNGDLSEGYEGPVRAPGTWRSGAHRGVSRSRGRDPRRPRLGDKRR